MIQILKLREFYSDKQKKNIKAEVGFDLGMRAATVEDIFSRGGLPFIEGKLTESERFNLYYTIADCIEEKGRKLSVQHHIPFDVDKIEIQELGDGTPDFAHLTMISKIICEAIGVPFEKCGVLFSGGGLQVVVGTTHPIDDVAYFDRVRGHYKAVCDRINLRLMQAKIKGEADPSVWSPARLMRLPDTRNEKPGRPVRVARILQGSIERVDFDLKRASGLPDVQATEQIAESIMSAFPTPDVKTIMSECKFLAWAQTHADKVTEPEWYASNSVTARFPEGRKFTHKMSEGHPGYSYAETDQKIDQALASSGPRTCANINAISGGKCQSLGCKHFGTSLKSPILIEGPDHVRTSKAGFYNFFVNPETGILKKGKPDFEGLQRWFQRENKYVSIDTARTIWTWNGKFYEEYSRDRVYKYAQEHFDPKPNTQMRAEFFEYVRLENMVPIDWFAKSIEGKMNFQNGVFDVKSGILSAHTTELGFRSVLPCNYAPKADAPRFKQFLDEVTLGRQGLIDSLQEFMGYIFANGDCKYQKILVLLGEGENGKSKFVDLIRALAGQDGFSSLSIKDMNGDQNRYLLEGKLVNIAEENSSDAFRDTELVKNFAGGGFVRVKKLYAQPYEYRNRTKLVMLCNTLPKTLDTTHGFYRRLMLTPFDQTFTDAKNNKDPRILEKMLTELPGIFNWVMDGYRRLEKQDRFTETKEGRALLLRYQEESDPILTWISDYLEYCPDGECLVNKVELYEDYSRYCDQNGLKRQASGKLYEQLRKFVRLNGGIAHEERKRKDGVRVHTINHLKHLSVPQF